MIRTIAAALAGLAVAMLMGAAPASAETRTWVSAVGDDANPCSRAAPCKSFAGALARTDHCGEIDALDPGDFEGLTITEGVTIDGGGGQVASVEAVGGNGITINVTDPACTRVIIRNLRIQGLAPAPVGGLGSPGINGILVLAGNVLLEHDDIENFSNDCVSVQTGTAFQLTIVNSDFVGCGGAGLHAAPPAAGGAPVQVSITGSTFEQNGAGVVANANVWIAIHNSAISQNTDGVVSTGNNAVITIDNTSISNNSSIEVWATANGKIGLAANSVTLTPNFGLKRDTGGTITSFGNNWVEDVAANDVPSSTVAAP